MTTEQKFEAAVNVIQSLPKDGSFQPSNEMKLKFYGHYKQATQGPCSQARPGFWDVVGRAKHDAWASLGSMDREQAMQGYIEALSQIIETMNFSADVETFMEVLGPFYEYVEDKISPNNNSTSELKSLQDIVSQNGIMEDEEDELDNLLGRYPDIQNNTMRRTTSGQDVCSVTLDARKTDMNHNCFAASPSEEDEEDLLENLVHAAGQELKNASSLLQEIQMSCRLQDSDDSPDNARDSLMDIEDDSCLDDKVGEDSDKELYQADENESSKTGDTVINKNNDKHTKGSLPSDLEESDDEVFEDSIETAADESANKTLKADKTPAPKPTKRIQSTDSYYIGDSRKGETPLLPPLPSSLGLHSVHMVGAAGDSDSITSTPLYPEEELIVYSSGDSSQPSRILMRPLDKPASAQNRYNQALVERLEGEVELVNSNILQLTSRFDMMANSLEHMTARLGGVETSFQQLHARINTIEYLMQVILSREESRVMSKSNLVTASVVSCAALLLVKVFASKRS